MPQNGQQGKKKRGSGGKARISSITQQSMASHALPPRPVSVPARSPFNFSMAQTPRLEQRLVMTPKLGFKSDDEIVKTVAEALVPDPSKVG